MDGNSIFRSKGEGLKCFGRITFIANADFFCESVQSSDHSQYNIQGLPNDDDEAEEFHVKVWSAVTIKFINSYIWPEKVTPVLNLATDREGRDKLY